MNNVTNMTDRQWCQWLEAKYGELMAMTIYEQFPNKDGTAPVHFMAENSFPKPTGPAHCGAALSEGTRDARRVA